MWALALASLISLPCGVHLWRRKDAGLLKKVFWSAVLLLPLLGPLFYGSLFRSLSPGAFQSTRNGVADASAMTHRGPGAGP